MRLAQTIYQLRIQKGMSQGDLAEALEVSRQSVSKWENGGATPDLDKLVKLSALFGVTLDELTGHLRQKDVLDLQQVQYAILETNGNIQTMFVYDIDNEKYVRYVLSDDGRIVTCTGEWFNVTLDFSRPEEIQLAVLPNTSGKDRSIRIEAQRFGKGTSVEVSQKAV